ncbi:copia protein [Tanacetum coccineum]|uniref:Copia protein n=1 Tax=Tanacetum coccineum TaxID=301880 RepID=A0ABQ4YDI4_9ASTR
MSGVLINNLDAGNPLFLHSNDHSNVSIVNFKLTGSENNKMWSTTMKISLKGKNKMGFIDGTCVKLVTSVVLPSNGKCVMILFLFETLVLCLKNSIWVKYILKLLSKLMQFLMGLNDVYQPIMSNLLEKDPLPDVNDAFAIVSREESHRGLGPHIFSLMLIVGHPNGALAKISVNGSLRLTNNVILFDVLVVPKYNDLKLAKIMGTSSESSGLIMFSCIDNATEEVAAEAYDIAAINFRGMNVVTNFEMNQYDVEAISSSSLPFVGSVKRLKVITETEQKPSLISNHQLSYYSSGPNYSMSLKAILVGLYSRRSRITVLAMDMFLKKILIRGRTHLLYQKLSSKSSAGEASTAAAAPKRILYAANARLNAASSNLSERNDEMIHPGGEISVFSSKGRPIGGYKTCDLSEPELMKIHTYIVNNCPEMGELINEHKVELEEENFNHLNERHDKEFASWLQQRVNTHLHSVASEIRILSRGPLNSVNSYSGSEAERDQLKQTLEKFQNSSKSLNEILEYQVIDKFKKGLGYNAATAASPAVEGNFIPRKPDLTFIDEIVKSENLNVTTVKQTALAISTTEAEYVSAEKASQQALWMKQALIDYDIRLDEVSIVCDNKGAIDLSKNLVQHSRTNHIKIRHHFLHDNVQKGHISIEKVLSVDYIIDILTKPLKRESFDYLRLGLGMMEHIP